MEIEWLKKTFTLQVYVNWKNTYYEKRINYK